MKLSLIFFKFLKLDLRKLFIIKSLLKEIFIDFIQLSLSFFSFTYHHFFINLSLQDCEFGLNESIIIYIILCFSILVLSLNKIIIKSLIYLIFLFFKIALKITQMRTHIHILTIVPSLICWNVMHSNKITLLLGIANGFKHFPL